MKLIAFIAFGLMTSQPCRSRTLPQDDSVVSVYLKNPSTADNNKQPALYLLSNGIADRIVPPISNWFDFLRNGTKKTTTKRPFHRIELLEDMEHTTKPVMDPLSNEIPKARDVEELSEDGIFKNNGKKPEKMVLTSNTLPVKERIELNNTLNEVDIDSDFDFDMNGDDEESKPRQGGIVYFLEVIGSVIQLLWGGLLALFQPHSS